jgi:hypothetical protein
MFQPWISLRSMIFRGTNFSRVVVELWRSSSPERHFCRGIVRLLQQSLESGYDCSGLSSRTNLELFTPWKPVFSPYGQLWWHCSLENLAPRRNFGVKHTWTDAIYKKVYRKTILILKSKINLIQKTRNFVSIQWNYLQAYSISSYYPFNKSRLKNFVLMSERLEPFVAHGSL